MSDIVLHRPASQDATLLAVPGITVERSAPLARFAFRGDAVAAGKAGAAFGASLPMTALHANAVADRAALWLGPDEWLLLARPDGDNPEAAWSAASTIGAGVTEALSGVPHALVDVSERNVALVLTGDRVAELLNTQVFLDLDETAFPVGQVTRTLFTKAEITLWRTAPDQFVIEVWHSFAPYIEGLLTESARGL